MFAGKRLMFLFEKDKGLLLLPSASLLDVFVPAECFVNVHPETWRSWRSSIPVRERHTWTATKLLLLSVEHRICQGWIALAIDYPISVYVHTRSCSRVRRSSSGLIIRYIRQSANNLVVDFKAAGYELFTFATKASFVEARLNSFIEAEGNVIPVLLAHYSVI